MNNWALNSSLMQWQFWFCSCVAGASKAICWHSSFYTYIWRLKGKLALFIIVWFIYVLELKLSRIHSFGFCSKTETPFLYLTSNRAQGPMFPSMAWASSVSKLFIIWYYSRFFSAVLVANFEFAGFALKQKYTGWTVSMETVHTAKSWPRKNQLGLPYNNL